MKQFEVNGKQYVAVEGPDGANQFSMLMHQLWGLIPPNQGITIMKILPAGEYEIIGLVKDLATEDPHRYNEELCNEHNLSPNDLILKRK